MPLIASPLKAGAVSSETGASGPLGPFDSDAAHLINRQQQTGPLAAGSGAQVQHTVHDLEPLTRYWMRVVAVNALGQSRPSVALSLRTEEEGE